MLLFLMIVNISLRLTTEASINTESPDLRVAFIDDDEHTIEIEAYQSQKNHPSNITRMRWYSFGNPTLTSTLEKNKMNLFHFTPTRFYTHVSMLTNEHRKLFVELIKEEYGIEVQPRQIENMILSKLTCNLTMYNENGSQSVMKGEVSYFKNHPLQLNFEYSKEDYDRVTFMKYYSEKEQFPLIFNCELSTMNDAIIHKFTLSTEKLIKKSSNYIIRNFKF